MLRLCPLVLLVLAVAVSRTFAFQGRLCQRHQKQWERERRRTLLWRTGANNRPLFKIYSNVRDQPTGIEEQTRIGPSPKLEKTILIDPPFMISRRSAATSMVTTVASILFSVPVVALAEDEVEEEVDKAAALVSESNQSPTATTKEAGFDAPVEKERTIEYTVQDFALALPANWKVITKYDGKPTKTPTLFSAIDFNSGAVLSVVREEACGVADYAKSAFEKSPKQKNAKKCDFALKTTEGTNRMNLFSAETYEKDASKLLIRHDDRDNAVLGAVSNINESKLTGSAGLRNSPPELLPLIGDTDTTRIDSYSSSLLELSAITTIPTGGTYRDTMGLEQPNTIQRKVLAKAVATTTRIIQKAEATMEEVPPSPSESRIMTNEAEESATESEIVASAQSSNPDVLTSTPMPTNTLKESEPNSSSGAIETGAMDALQETNTESSVVATTAATADNGLKLDENTASDSTDTATQGTVEENIAKSEVTEVASTDAFESSESQSIKASMMAMIATIDDAEESPSSESSNRNSVSADEIEKAVEAAMEKAMATAIEAVKDNTIEPTIEAVMETAKVTAKEMAKEMLATKAEDETADSTTTTTTAKATASVSTADEFLATKTVATASTPDANVIDPQKTASLPTSQREIIEDASSSPESSTTASDDEPPAAPDTTTTMTTSVLSIWLSAPMDEWQKPAMGTRLNQIWESVEYTSDIIEGTDNIDLLDDDSMNAQLLLLNNKGLLR